MKEPNGHFPNGGAKVQYFSAGVKWEQGGSSAEGVPELLKIVSKRGAKVLNVKFNKRLLNVGGAPIEDGNFEPIQNCKAGLSIRYVLTKSLGVNRRFRPFCIDISKKIRIFAVEERK